MMSGTSVVKMPTMMDCHGNEPGGAGSCGAVGGELFCMWSDNWSPKGYG